MIRGLRLFLRELRDFSRLFSDGNRRLRTLAFYSERDIYWRYFEGFIERVLAKSDLDVCYLTSDPDDPVFRHPSPRVRAFYLRQLVPAALRRLDGAALVMTMPDLELFHVKRSVHPLDHVYVFHGVGSIHLQYRPGAFDHYDTVFCLGPYDQAELRRWEELHGAKPKRLVACGYPWIERLHAEHQRLRAGAAEAPGRRPRVLIAPSWHEQNLLALCLEPLVERLAGGRWDVVFRPHPEDFKRRPALVDRIDRLVAPHANLTLERELVSGTSIHEADVLVTDWSAISFEYAFGTERPVLFVDTPCKVHNRDWEKLGIEPIELRARSRIGRAIDPARIDDIGAALDDLLGRRAEYRDRIVAFREETLFHWMRAAEVGGDELVALCRARGTSGGGGAA